MNSRPVQFCGFLVFCALFFFPPPLFALEVDPSIITAQLADNNDSDLNQALGSISTLLETEPQTAVRCLRDTWLPSLLRNGRYLIAADLARQAIFESASDTTLVEYFQRTRVRALLKAGRSRQALSDARSFFNVATMAETERAILLVAECLNAPGAADADQVDLFRRQQIAGAATQPSSATTRQAPSILAAIPIDAAPYAAAIEDYDVTRYLFRTDEFRNMTGRGNLLLLAGRSNEALELFRRIHPLAGPNDGLVANENIARALKAVHSCIGPANAYILQLKEQP